MAAPDIWEIGRLTLFLMFFIPGFISIKVYELLVPSRPRDFSSSIFEVVAYSALNYIILSPFGILLNDGQFSPFSWLIIFVNSGGFSGEYGWLIFLITLIFFVILFPALWSGVAYKILKSKRRPFSWVAKLVRNPIPQPWDWVFGGHAGLDPEWIIIHFKNGDKLGGLFGERSFVSSYPDPEQIYLEKIYPLDENGNFEDMPFENSRGMIIPCADILAIEFVEGA